MSEQDPKKQRCIKYLAKEYSEEECITFEIDLLFDEELKSTYQTYRLLWRSYPTNSEVWQQAQEKPKKRFRFLSSYYGQVACTFFMLVASFCIAYQVNQPGKEQSYSDYAIYTNTAGIRKKVTLEDGSVVTLNGKTRLQYTQNDSMRLAWLEGEAFFDVVKNTHKKFIVKHEDLEIEVVGTQFSVNTLSNEKKVALLSGKILAKMGNGEQLYLKPNEQLLWNTTLGEVKRLKADVDQQTSWRENKLVFNNEPLAQALIEINHFYGVSFYIQDKLLVEKRITGVFDNQSLAEFIQAFAFITNSTITLQNNRYLIDSHAKHPLSKKQQ